MTCFVCETCGTQFAEQNVPPTRCPICEDDRQYVGWQGQRWLTMQELAQNHQLRIGDDDGLLGVAIEPSFAIPQRALLLPTDYGNILWECLSLVTDAAVDALSQRGGVRAIIISHPHFYSSMHAWSVALGGVPIVLHEADRAWIQGPSPNVVFWSGDVNPLSRDVTLLRCGGHFPGSTALHWRAGPRGPTLFPGDALQVAMDRRHVAFMYSYPNHIPMKTSDVRHIQQLLAPYDIEDVFGFSWGRNILGHGRGAVDASLHRHLLAAKQ
ncbi:MBL fold metallo-hydrolase [Ahniella affigens]|uniref:MBL fold metallo-hydrolase n=1 Tax=Ahniella affigens TaxID=2021234 RepID=A0A2P1PY37_9GAMM|nr:MBL fold metallo-hydrolase [Ahniella affigens]AVP99724.1 MBL fold metallo-hydrolase [Ahniella affigens]